MKAFTRYTMAWTRRRASLHHSAFFVILLLALVYLSTLQTIPNGADHYLMADVGETQVVLNVWGTLHATGYPLYVMTGSLLTDVLTALGVPPVIAPALVSLLWGLVALALVYVLMLHLSRRALLSAGVMGVYGLSSMVWIHHSIAEIYTFGLLLLVLLLLLALWRGQVRGRIYWLALVGGLALGHHRATITLIPALVYAVWPELTRHPRRLPRVLAVSLFLGLLGLLPYVYLPLRANAGALWVYGEPGTLAGLWEQFIGVEASRYIGLPASLLGNFLKVSGTLIADLTFPGLAFGVGGLLLGISTPRHRRAALTLLLNALAAYLFHVFFYSDILVALILPVTLSLAFGWLFLGDWLLVHAVRRGERIAQGWRYGAATVVSIALLLALLAGALYTQHRPLIEQLTRDTTGLQSIAQARQVAPGSTLMIAWGSHHFAVGFARDVLGELPDVTLVDHKADFAALVTTGRLVTPAYTFYERPPDWWAAQLGSPVHLRAAAPGLVQISTAPQQSVAPHTLCAEQGWAAADCTGVAAAGAFVSCEAETIMLAVDWVALNQPERDLSVFVHLRDAGGAVIAQADQSAPVYGWYPLTRWRAGEVVGDLYPLPRLPEADSIRYGLYHQLPSGAFENVYEAERVVDCTVW